MQHKNGIPRSLPCHVLTVNAICLQPKVIADYDFKAGEDEELDFKRGEIITIIHKRDPNWWLGEIMRGNKPCRGLVPSTYVRQYVD